MAFQSQAAILEEGLRQLRTAAQAVEAPPEDDSAFASIQDSHNATVSLLEKIVMLVTTMANFVCSPSGQQ